MPVDDDIFEFGKNIHALASYYLRGENIDNLEKVLHDNEREIWNYLKSCNYFSYTLVGTEYNLSVKVDGKFFGGRLDALVKNGSTYYILDYKTGGAPKGAEKDFQTIIYVLAVKEFFKADDIKFVYLDLKNKKEVVINYSPELEQVYKNKLITVSQKMELSDLPPKKNSCDCEYKKICF